MDHLLLTPEETAEMLRVGKSTVYDLMRAKALGSVRIGRRRLVPAQCLRAYIDALPLDDAP